MTKEKLTALFDEAIAATKRDDDSDESHEMQGLVIATCLSLGFDWEKDDGLVRYCLKATPLECMHATKTAALLAIFKNE